ncbi:MAG: S-methyl-5'-thioadenosine phosphorylase [Anaerolineae bacterium]
MEPINIGVIGGSGLYNMPELTDKTEITVETPYGPPSAPLMVGTLHGQRVVFLPRHGIGHTLSPSTLPYRANIYALKALGVRFILSVSACGSLREDYAPGHIVVPDQLFDYTKSERGGRTFFESGLVAHVSVADPFSPELSAIVAAGVDAAGGVVHHGGTFVTIEGPRFSTKGESHLFRQWGCSIIGMTTSPEAFLAREAEIAYAAMAHITDYDVWHDTEEPVTVEAVTRMVQHNIDVIRRALVEIVRRLDVNAVYPAHDALSTALTTDRSQVSAEMLERLRPIVGRYFQ